MYNILVLGGGGREHALSWKIAQSPKCKNLLIAPGNAGTSAIGTNIQLNVSDFEGIREIVNQNKIDYIIVGPEAPLVEGVYDYFEDHEVKVIGPSKKASQLEGSKSFANEFMAEFGIPTAGSLTVTKDNIQEGIEFISRQKQNIVLKADGLAAGKGVLILDDKNIAEQELKAMLDGKFGEASKNVVIEEFLDGIEFSVFVITDGEHYQLLPIAKDYKRIGEGDTGLNTGGMGAVSPVSFVTDELLQKVIDKIIEPTIAGLKSRQYTYHGFIFFGLIKVGDEPYVIEYNCRLGDPETEVIIPRIEGDIIELFEGVSQGDLHNRSITFSKETAATIMLVSAGYPEAYEKGKPIRINGAIENSIVFHAGTKEASGEILTNGGRVMAITSLGADMKTALGKSMETIESIRFEGMNYRRDIGFDL